MKKALGYMVAVWKALELDLAQHCELVLFLLHQKILHIVHA